MADSLNNVYRWPHELASVLACGVGAGLLLIQAPMFLLSPAQGQVAALALCGLAARRWHQAQRILRYRRAVRRSKPYALLPHELPSSPQAVFLGKGFEWTAEHTQRMVLLAQPENDHLRRPSALYQWARRREREANCPAWLQRLIGWPHSLNPLLAMPPVGGMPALHGMSIDEQDVWTPLAELNNHMMVYGTTRVGKTRLAQILIEQDIQRGDVVIVFDPKGDVELLLGMYSAALRAGREDDFMLFHLGFPEVSARYNPIGNFEQITEVATRATGPLPDQGQSAAFKAFAWRYVNVIARAMSAVGERPDFRKVYEYGVSVDKLGAST
ncbi:type IV secretion system DNA-binding domain-containing protein [Ideonella paludis]|uniref:type IV secretion system DNA-binding domain-containing protein n=1 Tax=Ideonella paludis TaxID=1233411 RepID=UPI00363DCD02